MNGTPPLEAAGNNEGQGKNRKKYDEGCNDKMHGVLESRRKPRRRQREHCIPNGAYPVHYGEKIDAKPKDPVVAVPYGDTAHRATYNPARRIQSGELVPKDP